MRAIVIDEYGGVDKLKLVDLPVPEAGEHEILVQIKAAGVNAVDTYFREGFLDSKHFPLIMGSDFAGVVTAIGSKVSEFKVGDEVYGYKYMGNGTYCEYMAIPTEFAAIKPKGISFEEAAAIPCAGLIAYDCLVNTLGLKSGETVMITGAGGGVGSFAVQIAKHLGAKVIAVSGPDGQEYLRKLGADEIVDYTKGDYVQAVRKLYPQGVDTALAAADPTIATAIGAVKDNGRMTWTAGPKGAAPERGIEATYTNGSRGTALLDAFTKLVEAGAVKVYIDTTYTLDQAAEAQEEVRRGHAQGKLVIKL
jgi:NADPH:quinone reductase-like Zn-dependent oxidoreductase